MVLAPRVVAALVALAAFPIIEGQAIAAPSTATTGVIKGIIRGEDGKGLPGATVIVDCSCMAEARIVTTNSTGLYRVKGLPAGIFNVQATHSNVQALKTYKLERGATGTVGMTVRAGEETRVVHIEKAPVGGDPGGGIALDASEIDKVAAGGADRDPMAGAIAVSATGGSDAGGDTLIGASSAETNYVVDGLRTSSPGNGMVAMSTISEFIGSVEVLEGGYSAQYGLVSGGQIRARRIAGGDKTRGRARFTFTPRLAEPRTIVGTDDAIRAVETPDWAMQGVASFSGPLVGDDPTTKFAKWLKGRGYWSAGVAGSGTKATLSQDYFRRLDVNQSGGYDDCPYENGAGDCEDGKDYITTEKFGGQDFRTGSVGVRTLLGFDLFVSPKHHLAATMRVQPQYQRRAFRRPLSSIDPDSLGASPNASVGGGSTVANGIVNDHLGWARGNGIGSSLEYNGRSKKNNVEIDALVGFLQTSFDEAWKLDDPNHKLTPSTQYNDSQGKSLFALLDAEGRLSDVPGVAEACNDSGLPGKTCPVRSWVSGGIGQYSKEVSRRIQSEVSLTHFFDGAGAHQLKYGAQFEHLMRKREVRYSGSNESDFYDNCGGQAGGGEWCHDAESGRYSDLSGARVNNNRQIFVGSNDPNSRVTRGFGRVQRENGSLRAIADPLGNGARVDAYRARVSTQNYSLFLQDRWAITNSLFVEAGARWEMQDMRDILGRPAIRIADNVAPRIGLVYDWTEEGKSRLFVHYGWFFQQMPLALVNRVYGGLVDVGRDYKHQTCQGNSVNGPDGNPREQTLLGQPTEFCTDSGGSTTGLIAGATVPHLRGQYDQSFQVGYQHEVIEDLTLEVRWLHRDLGRAVEDISTDGGANYIVANPGVSVGAEAIAAQSARCDTLSDELDMLDEDDPTIGAKARESARCRFLEDAYSKVDTLFAKPTRNYDAFSLQMVKRFGNNWMFVGSYTFARNVGNYGGFVDPVSGAVNVGSSSQYDLPELVRNNFGPLPNDVRHRLNANGAYTFDMQESGAVSVGGGVVYQSGTPVSVRAGHNRYPGQFPTHVVPRGMGGRLAPNYQVNATLEYAYPVADTMTLGVAARLFNLTNAKATLRVDDRYSVQNTRPIAGGSLSDLKHAKVEDPGRPGQFFDRNVVERQGNYLVETAFQLPLTAQFDIRLTF